MPSPDYDWNDCREWIHGEELPDEDTDSTAASVVFNEILAILAILLFVAALPLAGLALVCWGFGESANMNHLLVKGGLLAGTLAGGLAPLCLLGRLPLRVAIVTTGVVLEVAAFLLMKSPLASGIVH